MKCFFSVLATSFLPETFRGVAFRRVFLDSADPIIKIETVKPLSSTVILVSMPQIGAFPSGSKLAKLRNMLREISQKEELLISQRLLAETMENENGDPLLRFLK